MKCKKVRNLTNLLLLDGYVDEPGCLGVPPYLAPYPRYIYGTLIQADYFSQIDYLTIDQFRKSLKNHAFQPGLYDWIIIISGVSVPGKYLGGDPIKFSELQRFAPLFNPSLTFLCGPATRFGIGEEGGKPSFDVSLLSNMYDFIITGDSEIFFMELLKRIPKYTTKNDKTQIQELENFSELLAINRNNMEQITEIATKGATLILQHPNFKTPDQGNLICEIETFRGCPRYQTGGCSFCIEPLKGKTIHRSIDAIVNEVKALYTAGVRHFRLGAQTDFFAFQHREYEQQKYPRPNPDAIQHLLSSIRSACPDLKTLHIDNVNALNFALYPLEARAITESIVKYCTAGNIAAIGVESVDSLVIERNNLKASAEQIMSAVEMINELGNEIGDNGNPKFLPGLNFIMGLPGETEATLELNRLFLKNILQRGLLLRRLNLRKLLTSPQKSKLSKGRDFSKDLEKNERLYYNWKNKIREEIDFPMLKRVFPFGRLLQNVYAETYEGNGTFARQCGTYPILCYVPKKLVLFKEYTLIVIDHGFRSLTCLEAPLTLVKLSFKELESIPGIGKKRAGNIMAKNPKSHADWMQIVSEDIYGRLRMLDSSLP